MMEKTMRAAVVSDFKKPLELKEIPRPAPNPHQILVKIHYCGVCHTDLHAAHGDWPVQPGLPFVPGHEGVGVVEDVLDVTGGGAHGVLITAASQPAFTQGVDMLRRGGTVSLVGLPPGSFELPIFDVVLTRKTVRGSIVGNRNDLNESLEFAARGDVSSHIHLAKLDEINDIFERMIAGSIEGRIVLDLTS